MPLHRSWACPGPLKSYIPKPKKTGHRLESVFFAPFACLVGSLSSEAQWHIDYILYRACASQRPPQKATPGM